MSCDLGKTGTRFAVNSQVFVILFWFFGRTFQALGKNKRCARHAGCVSRKCLSVYYNVKDTTILIVIRYIYFEVRAAVTHYLNVPEAHNMFPRSVQVVDHVVEN